MKKIIPGIITVFLAAVLASCSVGGGNDIINVFERTKTELDEEYYDSGREIVYKTYYELSDGTYKTDLYSYEYKIIATGTPNNSGKELTFTVLSNSQSVTFEQTLAASGLSSNSKDYFKVEDAVIVAVKTG